jgi:hypothetical protein
MRETPSGPSFWQTWWKATLVLFLIRCALGFLSAGGYGLGSAMGSGLVVAPIGGLIVAGIMTAIRKN